METKEISNHEEIIDSRDVIARIDELEVELSDWREEREEEGGDYHEDDFDSIDELLSLRALAEDASGSSDWPHGEVLIRDSYFMVYAEDLARDIGAISDDAQWPLTYIDWDAAADALRQDYIEVSFDGVAYQIRA